MYSVDEILTEAKTSCNKGTPTLSNNEVNSNVDTYGGLLIDLQSYDSYGICTTTGKNEVKNFVMQGIHGTPLQW